MKISVKYLYIITFCALITNSVEAQNTDTLVFQSRFVRSVGLGFPTLNYSLLSPLNHSGYSLGFLSTRFREKQNHLNQFQIYSEIGTLYNHANDSYITLLGFDGRLSRHWRVTDNKFPFQFLPGAETDIGVNIYMKDDNTNNPMAYFFNLSIKPSILFRYGFKINDSRFELWQQFDFPLFSLVSSSAYSSSLPAGIAEDDASFFDAVRIASFGSLKKCTATTTLDISSSWQRHKRLPEFRITYTFSGMNYKNNDMTIKYANNMFLFGMIFYLGTRTK
jgi:hypothetical protein